MTLGRSLIAVLIPPLLLGAGSLAQAQDKPAPKDAKKEIDIRITNPKILMSAEKYRYFFRIENQGTKSFEGQFRVTILNSDGKPVIPMTMFLTLEPFEPGDAKTPYLDLDTG